MALLYSFLIAASLLAAPSDTVTVKDATPLIRPECQGLARKLAISPAFVPTTGNEYELISSGKRYADLLYADFRAAASLIEL